MTRTYRPAALAADRGVLQQQADACARRLAALAIEQADLDRQIADAAQKDEDTQILAVAGVTMPAAGTQVAALGTRQQALAAEQVALTHLQTQCAAALVDRADQERRAQVDATRQVQEEAAARRLAALGRVNAAREELAAAIEEAGSQPFADWVRSQPRMPRNEGMGWLNLLAQDHAACLDTAESVATAVQFLHGISQPGPAGDLQTIWAMYQRQCAPKG